MANLIGQQRGNFKLTRLLGQGGFAEVYLGENIYAQNNKVAIKILNAHLDEKGIQQFKGEANTLTSLRHPHIIQVTDFGFDNTIPYLIMEYAPNGSLANRHPIGTSLPIATVVDYIKQVAEALQYAHNNKIIHRDVKPENMLIGQNDAILLSDFGIARVIQTYSVGTVHIVGSIQYMSPEQWDKKAVFASDQYSLGVVAYQWLCGNLPFQGEMQQLWYQHRTETPPPFPAALSIAPNIENVIMKALDKDPQQRYANIQEFAVALEQVNKGSSFPVQPLPSKKVPERKKSPTQIQPSQPLPNIDINTLYRQCIEAYAKGEEAETSHDQGNQQKTKDFFEEAERGWQHILTVDPNYMNGTLKTRFTNLQQRLHPIRIQELRRHAEDYHRAGSWQEAIQTWGELLKLEPNDATAQESISVARHNMQYAPMYATAQQLVQEGKLAAAKVELAELKIYAPEYGDPAGLAAQLNPPVPLIENVAYIEPSYHAYTSRSARQQRRINFVRALRTTNIGIWLNIFLFLSGTGITSGLVAGNWLSQSWIVAIGIVVILAVVAYWLGYRRATHPLSMIAVTLLSTVVVFAITWYTSRLSYSRPAISSFWFAHYVVWIGRQVNLGLIIGLISLVPCAIWFGLISRDFRYNLRYDTLDSFGLLSFVLAIGVASAAILYIILGGIQLFLGWRLGEWGWGFGFGWYFAWFAILPTIIAGLGLVQFLKISLHMKI